MQYPETCTLCGSPSRTETIVDERVGIEEFQFCNNPACFHYDKAGITKRREEAEEAARKTKAFSRKRKKLWRTEIKTRKVAIAKQREAMR